MNSIEPYSGLNRLYTRTVPSLSRGLRYGLIRMGLSGARIEFKTGLMKTSQYQLDPIQRCCFASENDKAQGTGLVGLVLTTAKGI